MTDGDKLKLIRQLVTHPAKKNSRTAQEVLCILDGNDPSKMYLPPRLRMQP